MSSAFEAEAASAVGAIDSREHAARLHRLGAETFDLLVIGGGITGAGIAREAALRGLSVALVDADDFSAGTSSRSTKLIHGGLRYLAMGDFALVRETARERQSVYRMAPHLAEPTWTLLPAKNRLELLKYRVGVGLYEWLGQVDRGERGRTWTGHVLHDNEPALIDARYPYACAYREYLTDDSRLVLAVLRASAAQGACLVNRARVVGFSRGDDGAIASAQIQAAGVEAPITVRAQAFVNAAGPWVEQLCLLEAEPEQRADTGSAAPTRLHLSKGVHVVLPRARLPINHIVMINTSDARILFAVPRDDVVYLGTTDTTYEPGAELWPDVTPEDVSYLLAPLTDYFDLPALTAEDCLGAWAGLRPLIADPGKAAKEISRKDEVWIGSGGLITIAGGKLTGFRKMAEMVLGPLGQALGRTLDGDSRLDVLPGGDLPTLDLDAHAAELASRFNTSSPCAARLVRLYGNDAEQVLALGAEPLTNEGLLVVGEVLWAVVVEGAGTVEDVVYRRTRAAFYQRDEAIVALPRIAMIMGQMLGWCEQRVTDEQAQALARMESDLSFMGGQDVAASVASAAGS